MLQVVFSDSERGSLKLATHWSCINSEDGPIGFIFGEGETTPEEQERAMAKLKAQWEEEKRRARPVGGSPGDVLCPSYGLDMGPLSGPNVDKARFNLLTAWLGGDFPLPDSTPEDYAQQRDQMWEQRQQDRSRLLETAENGEAVRIWYSPAAPWSLCGFYEVCWLLRSFDCPVTALELPQWMPREDGTVQSCLSWGELVPGDWAAFLPLEREIPKSVRRAIAMEWAELRKENAPLRAVVNGRLVSVGEDFYDPFIRAHIPNGVFRVAQLIGEVLGRERLGIGDWCLAKRIKAMLDQGELITVSKGDGFYRDEVRRAS